MAYTEITRTGYLGRIGESIKGVVFGLVLLVISFPLLFWNEGRAVKMSRSLAEGKSATVHVDSAKIDPAMEGKLVHFTAKAINATGDKLTDSTFHVSQDAIHLKRDVLMYQWKENKKTEKQKDAVGGGETTRTTYSYEKVWEGKALESDNYKERGHNNPAHWRVTSNTLDASKVTAGAFTLNSDLINKIDNYTPVALTNDIVDGLDTDLKSDTVRSEDTLYVSNETGQKPDLNTPVIGDMKVSFKTVLPGDVSVIAKQTGSTLAPYQTANNPLQLLEVGNHSAAEIFKHEEDKNTVLTWVLRIVGFFCMWIGMALMLNPFKVLSDVIGIVGDLVGAGIAVVTGVAAIALSFLTIAIAWIAYRPMVGISLLVIAGAAVAGFVYLRNKGAAQRKAAVPQAAA